MNNIKFVGLHAHSGVGSPLMDLDIHKNTWTFAMRMEDKL